MATPNFERLQMENDELRRRLADQNMLQCELETIKDELEKVLETHKTLQVVALALEEKNRNLQEQYKNELRDRLKLDEVRLDLENEVESKTLTHENLEKRFQKLKDKLSKSENLEDLVYSLEKDKRRSTDRLKELEEELQTTQDGSGTKSKAQEDKILKLTKENKSLSVKLETYMEEMEEMDKKCENLEDQNKKLKKDYEQVKSIELVGSNVTELVELESRNEDLEVKLKKELQKRETVENELFKIEEEYESFKIAQEEKDAKLEAEIEKVNLDLFGRKISNGSSSAGEDSAFNDAGIKFLIRKKQKLLDILEKEKVELSEKIKSFEQEHDILLDENSTLAKANMQMTNKLEQLQNKCDTRVSELKDKLETVEDRRKQMEEENLSRLVTSAEKEYEYSQRYQENNREVEKMTGELKIMQEYLRLATDKNQELQIELDEVKRDLFQKLNEQQQSLLHQQQNQHKMERAFSTSHVDHHHQQHHHNVTNGETSSTSSLNSQESDKLGVHHQRRTVKHDDGEKEREYETRIQHQNNVIKSLEGRILSLRETYERRIQGVISNNNNDNGMSSPETTPPVAMKNGRLHDSMDELNDYAIPRSKSFDFISDDELDYGDSLSDRELRRISYRIADGNWKHLSNELNLKRKQDVNQILNSNYNDQEKIYRLLVAWRGEMDSPREELLKYLIDRVGSKRKDVVKFLKEMAGLQNKDGSIKTKFQKFKKSVKR